MQTRRPNNQRRKKPTPGFAARLAALRIIEEVLDKRQALDLILERSLAKDLEKLEPRDRALARAMATLVLRRKGELDHYIGKFLQKPLPKKAQTAQHILRLGFAQVLFMKVPDHAAVDIAVSLAQKEQTARPFKKLVNAVMRKSTTLKESRLPDDQAARYNTPDWLMGDWIETYGEEATAIAIAHLSEAPLDLTMKREKPAELDATRLPTGSYRLEKSQDVRALPGFETGEWWVQDAAAAIMVSLFADLKGKRVLDLCAAPGGKTMQLAAKGAEVTALDRSAPRMKRVEENLSRTNLDAELVVADALDYSPKEPFPFILIDAPCSATGTLRRHPDLAHLKSRTDVQKLSQLQTKLLEKAAKHLSPGGEMIYGTCSLEPAEGEDQIEHFLQAHKDFERVPLSEDAFPHLAPFINANGDLRILPSHWPDIGGLDGFFASRLRLLK